MDKHTVGQQTDHAEVRTTRRVSLEDQRAVLLADLIELDSESDSPNAFIECFGDRALCSSNPIYRRIREMFLNHGLRYSVGEGDIMQHYSGAPLLALPELIVQGTVPVANTAGTITHIVRENPRFKISWLCMLSTFRRNYLLHESAHLIAFKMLARQSFLDLRAADKTSLVIICLLCESYANAVEYLAGSLAAGSEMELLFRLNSYIEPERAAPLRDCMLLFGFQDILTLATLTFLRLNCDGTWSDSEAALVVEQTQGFERPHSGSDTVLKKLMVQRMLGLNKQFISLTTPTFFRYLECEVEYEEVCRVGLGAAGSATAWLLSALDELIQTTSAGLFETDRQLQVA